jgi:hypothetical protein
MAYRTPLKDCSPEEAARRRTLRAAYMRAWRARQLEDAPLPQAACFERFSSVQALRQHRIECELRSWLTRLDRLTPDEVLRRLQEAGELEPALLEQKAQQNAQTVQRLRQEHIVRLARRRVVHAAKCRRLRAKRKAAAQQGAP